MNGDYATHQFDNQRTGWNPHETALTVASVRHSFGLLFSYPVDGQVYAQPLFAAGVTIPGQGQHDVIFVATEGDSVYAFNATADAPPLWRRHLVPAGEAPVVPADIGGCQNVQPQVGITGTPVIDRATNTLYVVAKTRAAGGAHIHQRLHALDLGTGADKHGSPVEIQAQVIGTGDGQYPRGHIHFDPRWHLNRPALLLSQGSLYLGFGSHCDFGPYHGWVLRYGATTLHLQSVFNTTPDAIPPQPGGGFTAHGGAVWQSGCGLAADAAGHVYFLTGNGPFNAHTGGRDYGDAAVHLRPDLGVADYFAPFNQAVLNARDEDLGSGGVLLLPAQPGTHPPLLVACGKEGTVYLIDRQNMGGYRKGPGGSDHVVQRLPGAVGGVWGGPAYYGGPTGHFVYYCGNNDHLKAFRLANGALSLAGQSPDTFPHGPAYDGGAIPTVSSNGTASGSGIVWLVRRSNPLTLFAYDATNVTAKLFQGDAGPWTNIHGGPFMVPTVAHGRVFVGTADRVAVFGPKP